MADHDVPAMVEHVAAATGQQRMVYFGYSQVGGLQTRTHAQRRLPTRMQHAYPGNSLPERDAPRVPGGCAPRRAASTRLLPAAASEAGRSRPLVMESEPLAPAPQGSMIGLAALSSQPALAARVSLAILMAPVAFTRHMASPPFVISVRAGLDSRLEAAGWREWGAHRPAAAAAVAAACRWAPRACAAYLELICGANPHGNLEPATVAALMRHLPVGTSVRNMALWSQVGARGKH